MECEKMKKALALALVISMTFVGSMFAQAAPDAPGPNPEAPGQIAQETGIKPGAAEEHFGAPGQEGTNPGQIGNPGNGPKVE